LIEETLVIPSLNSLNSHDSSPLDTNNNFNSDSENEIMSAQKKRKFVEILVNHSFSGKWTSRDNLLHFENKVGKFRMFFQNYLMRGPKGSFFNFILFLYDGVNKERWIFIQNSLPLGNNGNTTNFSHTVNETKIEHKEIEVFVGELETFDVVLKKFDWINFEVISEEYYIPTGNGTFTNMIGSVKSTINKEFDFTFEIDPGRDNIYNKISNFSMILSIFATLQLFNSKHLMENFAESETQALRLSPSVLIINIIWNAFICFTNFVVSLYDDVINIISYFD
jgi:hypothetical protein